MLSNKFLFNYKFNLYLLITFAFIYGSIISPIFQETFTFSKTILGHYNYNFSNQWFHGIIQSPPTLQIYIISFLLENEANERLLSYFYSGLTTSISFLSFYYFSKIFLKSDVGALYICILFLLYKFLNTHWYGIYYPSSYFYFGQMGMYLCLLSISLNFQNKASIGIYVLIANFFLHSAWGVFNIFLYVIALFLSKKKLIVSYKHIYFFLFLLTLFILGNYHYGGILKENISKLYVVNNHVEQSKSYLKGHIPFFSFDNLNNIKNFILFFFYEALLFSFYFICRKKISKQAQIYFKTILIATSVIILYVIFSDFINNLLFILSPQIPSIIERMIPSRFLNIVNISVVLYGVTYIFEQALDRRNKFFIVYLSLFFFLITVFIIFYLNGVSSYLILYYDQVLFLNIVIWLSIPVTFFYIISPKLSIINFRETFFIKILKFQILIFSLVFLIIFLPNKFINSQKFINKNQNLLNNINSKNEIIVGPLIYGYVDVSYMSSSPIHLPLHKINSKIDNREIDVFCDNDNKTYFSSGEYFDFVNLCLSIKTKEDWRNIKKHLGSDYVVVRNYVKLNLLEIGNNGFIKVYKIQ